MSRYFDDFAHDAIELTEDELLHYGVLGMKWGVRKYQKYSGDGPADKFRARKNTRAAHVNLRKSAKDVYKLERKKAKKGKLSTRKERLLSQNREVADEAAKQLRESRNKLGSDQFKKEIRNSRMKTAAAVGVKNFLIGGVPGTVLDTERQL